MKGCLQLLAVAFLGLCLIAMCRQEPAKQVVAPAVAPEPAFPAVTDTPAEEPPLTVAEAIEELDLTEVPKAEPPPKKVWPRLSDYGARDAARLAVQQSLPGPLTFHSPPNVVVTHLGEGWVAVIGYVDAPDRPGVHYHAIIQALSSGPPHTISLTLDDKQVVKQNPVRGN